MSEGRVGEMEQEPMGDHHPLRECGTCKRSNVIMQTISFLHGGRLYRTQVLVCVNPDCVRKRGGRVDDHRTERSPTNMAKARREAGQ